MLKLHVEVCCKQPLSSHGSVHELGMVQGLVEEQVGGSRPSAWSLAPSWSIRIRKIPEGPW